jgi:hypothetical protein
MKKAPDKLVERPRPWRPKRKRPPAWLVLEPNRIGLIGGGICAWIALCAYTLAGVTGPHAIVFTLLVFVVGYACVGAFMYYVLLVGEREMPPPEEDPRKRFGKKVKGSAESEMISAADAAVQTGEAAGEDTPREPQ